MIFRQSWTGYEKNKLDDRFPARVPGNIQSDYANAHNYGDVNYGTNYKKYGWMEDTAWVYETAPVYEKSSVERVFFVSSGIDYEFDIEVNGNTVFTQEGMFTPVELDITDYLKEENLLKVIIYPVPKYANAPAVGRTQAVDSCKPAVGYEWDWHPRLICSGIWQDTYIETRGADYISRCEAFYELDGNFERAKVMIEADCRAVDEIAFYAPSGEVVYKGTDKSFTVENPVLWYCNGQGEPARYSYTVTCGKEKYEGKVGFRSIELVMNMGTWDEPASFPKTRSVPPSTIKLNGREIFAKGSNWVNPEIFTGEITCDRYRELLELVRDANMNILRCWGGAIINKDEFFDICDELGIMVWQEFPLACNDYIATEHYLGVLEREAVSIVKKVRKHPCHVLWCGGNELFNSWSKMTDQSLALRLINKVCYENDRNKPYIMTSPLMGMGHGHYLFYDKKIDRDAFQLYQGANNTAYSEFGIPGMPDLDYIKTFIPENELKDIANSECIRAHHGTFAWTDTAWMCLDVLEYYFGELKEAGEICRYSQWLQCEGYKGVFEEARRQKPHCSMVMNWCYNEPWKTAANNTLISYPAIPKKAYYAVANSLKDTVASARIPKFQWCAGELFNAELWLLNDSPNEAEDIIKAYLDIDGEEHFLMEWDTGTVIANVNKRGNIAQFILPYKSAESFTLRLVSENGYDNAYKLKYGIPVKKTALRTN